MGDIWVDASISHVSVIGCFETVCIAARERIPSNLTRNSTKSEGYAVHLGISVAMHYGPGEDVEIRTDAKALPIIFKKTNYHPRKHFYLDLVAADLKCSDCEVKWIHRDKNRAAHQLAHPRALGLWPASRLVKVDWSVESVQLWSLEGQPIFLERQKKIRAREFTDIRIDGVGNFWVVRPTNH